MNYGRLVAAAAAGTIADAVYGFVVYGMLLSSQFAKYPSVYRAKDASPQYIGVMFAGLFAAMCVAVFIYSKGIEHKGPGAAEGMRFGTYLGLFLSLVTASVAYGMTNIGITLAVLMGIAGIFEWMLVGTVLGAVYQPAAAPARAAQRATV